jgi:hypothetical protein
MDDVLKTRTESHYLGADEDQRTILWSAQDKIDDGAVFPPEQHTAPVREAGVFSGKKVLLGRELEINVQTKEALDQWITTAGGVPLVDNRSMPDCDIYITKWRDGADYSEVSLSSAVPASRAPLMIITQAVKLGKTIGTLMWFFFVLKRGRLTSPMDELLHYPVPRETIPKFSEYVSTVLLSHWGGLSANSRDSSLVHVDRKSPSRIILVTQGNTLRN